MAATAKMMSSSSNNRSTAAVIVRRESFPPIMDGGDGHGKSAANNRAIAFSDNNNGAMGQHKVGVLVEKNVAFKQQRSTSEEDSDVLVARFKEKIREQTANNDVKLSPMSTRERNKTKNHGNAAITYEKVKRHKQRKERKYRKSLQNKPRAISAAKERRGVKVLGIILGAYCCCWTPFFIMYLLAQFCPRSCQFNQHIEMFITWLGYSNSSMNPIIYTVFNKDYQIALKRLFTRKNKDILAAGTPRPNML